MPLPPPREPDPSTRRSHRSAAPDARSGSGSQRPGRTPRGPVALPPKVLQHAPAGAAAVGRRRGLRRIRRRRGRSPVHGAVSLVLWVGLIALGLWALSRLIGDRSWVLALAANTSYLAMYPLALVGLVALLTRRILTAGLALALAMFAMLPVAESLRPSRWVPGLVETPLPPGADNAPYRLLVLNMQDQPSSIAPLGAIVARERPDLVALIECSPDLINEVLANPDIATHLPFSSSTLPRERWPLLTLSRHPMHQATFSSGAPGYEWLFAYHRTQLVDLPQGRILFTATHVTSPTTAETWRQGNRGLEILVRCLRNDLQPTGVPILLGGDFNCTRPSHRFRWFEANSGLHPADPIGSIVGSWPTNLPGPLRIGIDQAWASPGLVWVERRVLEDVDSDHRPVLFGFRFGSAAPVATSR